jgi:cation:H+ antiporter
VWAAVAATVMGIFFISVGGELVARGAEQLVEVFGIPAALIGMVVTPAAIELEEVIRQVIPARRGHGDVSAGNVVGTLFYFTLFNLGLVASITPVGVPSLTRQLDWPFLVGATVVAAGLLARGRVGRPEGALLLAIGVAYATLHVLLR